MSETTEDKTKRKYLSVFMGNEWWYQTSVFYDDPSESHRLLTDMVMFKQRLRRVYADQPFLMRIQTKSGGGRPLQAYLTMFTTKPLDGMQPLVDKLFDTQMNVRSRKLTAGKKITIANAVGNQRPQDLSKVFGKSVNRWSVLNKPLLVAKTVSTVQD